MAVLFAMSILPVVNLAGFPSVLGILTSGCPRTCSTGCLNRYFPLVVVGWNYKVKYKRKKVVLFYHPVEHFKFIKQAFTERKLFCGRLSTTSSKPCLFL